jgi:hypothetical protein
MVGALAGLASAAESPANQWARAGDGCAKHRQGASLVWAPDLKKALLVGDGVSAFDPAANTWAELSPAKPAKDGLNAFYQTVYDAKSKSVYCLANSPVLYVFDVASNGWRTCAAEPLLEGLSWHTLAADGNGHVVVVGSDKKIENVGWTRTVILDTTSGKWSTLPLPADDVVKKHREHVAASEAFIDLVGRIRLAWYRDPKGAGTEAERAALLERADALAKLPVLAPFAEGLGKVKELIKATTLLDALKAAREIQRKVDDAAFDQYPVPRSRRNAPLAYDARNNLFVLFGGDHEDYQLNDTWTLDLEKQAWSLKKPALAPAPRGGHAMVFLPKSGKVAIYEGYIPETSGDYGATPWRLLDPRDLWVYDAKADQWDLLGAWPLRGGDAAASPPPVGKFYGYSSTWYEVPALVADDTDRLLLAAPATRNDKPAVWSLAVSSTLPADAASREKLGRPANERRLRAPYFRAEYTEVADDPKAKDLAAIPANQWVPLNPGPRVPARGCRQRDWSTTTWDPDHRQVLMWGGGHCVRSSSVPLHYSPVSNRIVEGYDADEPYCYNGWCGPASSLLNKQWIDTHAYHLYAYDPKCHLLVTARSFLYDPERMDWVREEPFPTPFRYSWGGNVLASSPHGVVAWGTAVKGEAASLWLFDRQKGWQPLEPKGKLGGPWCDTHGMGYDSKRDRMLLSGVGGGYNKKGDGSFLSFDFKTREIATVMPENAELNAAAGCVREVVYIEHADCVTVGDLVRVGDGKKTKARVFTRIYDCAKNKAFLLETGSAGSGFSAGWQYDAASKCIISFAFNGDAWALRFDPATATLLEKLPEAEEIKAEK